MAVIWTKKSKGVIVLDIETNPFTCGWLAPEPGKTYLDYPLDIRVAVVYSYDDDTYHTFGPDQQTEFFEMVNSAKRVVSYNGEGFDFLVMKALGFDGEISDSVDLCHRIKEYTGSKHYTSLDSIAKKHFGRRKQTKGRDMVNLDYEKLSAACKVDVEITKQIYENRQHWRKNSKQHRAERRYNNYDPDFSEEEHLVFKALKMSREYTPEWMAWAKNHLRKIIYKDKFIWLPEELRNEILTTLKTRLNNTVSEYTQWQIEKSEIYIQSYREYQPRLDALKRKGPRDEWWQMYCQRKGWCESRIQELREEKYLPEQLEKFTQMENDRELIWMLLRNLNSLYYTSPEYVLDIKEQDITLSGIGNPFGGFSGDKTHWGYIHRTPAMQYAKNLCWHHKQNKRRHRVNYRITDVLEKYPAGKKMMCDYYEQKSLWELEVMKRNKRYLSMDYIRSYTNRYGVKKRETLKSLTERFLDTFKVKFEAAHLILDKDIQGYEKTIETLRDWNNNLTFSKHQLEKIRKVWREVK